MTLRNPYKPTEVGSLTPKEEYALENWAYFDLACDYCGGEVPEFQPVIHDVWTPERGSLPKRVYCSQFCYHVDNQTEWYRAEELPNRFSHTEMPTLPSQYR